MRCEPCHGTGWVGHGMGGDTCGDCGGSGIVHCCEGLTACNDPETPEDAVHGLNLGAVPPYESNDVAGIAMTTCNWFIRDGQVWPVLTTRYIHRYDLSKLDPVPSDKRESDR